MGTHNTLHVEIECPHCRLTRQQEAETFFGFGNLLDYCINSEVQWVPGKQPQNGGRPPGGNSNDKGYVVCLNCGRDFFIDVSIVGDKIVDVEVSHEKGLMA